MARVILMFSLASFIALSRHCLSVRFIMKGAGFRGILPGTAAAGRAQWAGRGWAAEACADGSRRPLGASASNQDRLSGSARRERQGEQKHWAHASLLLQLLVWQMRCFRTLAAPYSSDSSFRRLDKNGRLWGIPVVCRVPFSLAVANNNKNRR